VPELPEVERARRLLADTALHRRIVDVDDTDTYVCRPHAPGQLRAALVGRELTAALRRGKSMWCSTSRRDDDPLELAPSDKGPAEGSGDGRGPATPDLGIHLGMGGVIVVRDADGTRHADGDRVKSDLSGGTGTGSTDSDSATDSERSTDSARPLNPVWDRFTARFADGGSLVLFDKRRLGRVRLDPDVEALGPDALGLRPAEFRARLGTSTAPVKARLLDQAVLAGVGNLLADEALWRAKVHPADRVVDLTRPQVDRLHRQLAAALDDAIAHGGVHTGLVIPARARGGHCPRCGAEMHRGTIGGRTTWWCSREQPRLPAAPPPG
jgi:formamidopyrimidine-DNA glycosylase